VPAPRPSILLADSDDLFRETLCRLLRKDGRRVQQANSPEQALSLAGTDPVRVAVVGEFGDGAWEALAVAQRVQKVAGATAVMFVPRAGSEELAVAAFRSGLTDYLRRPINGAELAARVDRYHWDDDCSEQPTDGFVCISPRMLKLRGFLEKVAKTDSTVLVTGESGTGKELVAKLIHESGLGADRPLVYVNCAALPDTLLESELFGYERGAFTGASRAYAGRFRQAAGGTIVLDEIGEMTPMAQAKLLRVIESRQIAPLGGRNSIPLEARIVAATNQDPESLMRDGRFRSDLYYRLNVARVHISPLRERREDILPLFEHFVAEFNRRRGTEVDGMTAEVGARLLSYNWPGNVRELRNLVETIFIDPPLGPIDMECLPDHFRSYPAATTGPEQPEDERERLLAVLTATRGNKSEAAKQLQWSRMTLYRKMMKYEVSYGNASNAM
jgi:DNA-binding NtrC family response regulator